LKAKYGTFTQKTTVIKRGFMNNERI